MGGLRPFKQRDRDPLDVRCDGPMAGWNQIEATPQVMCLTEDEGFPLQAPAAGNPPPANGGAIPERPGIPDRSVSYVNVYADGKRTCSTGAMLSVPEGGPPGR